MASNLPHVTKLIPWERTETLMQGNQYRTLWLFVGNLFCQLSTFLYYMNTFCELLSVGVCVGNSLCRLSSSMFCEKIYFANLDFCLWLILKQKQKNFHLFCELRFSIIFCVNIFVYLYYILLNVLKVLTPEFCAVLETLAKQPQDYIDL